MTNEEEYFAIFNQKPEDVSLIGFNTELHIILITLKSGERIKYENLDNKETEYLRCYCPFYFIGFQHSLEGVSFHTYSKLGVTNG